MSGIRTLNFASERVALEVLTGLTPQTGTPLSLFEFEVGDSGSIDTVLVAADYDFDAAMGLELNFNESSFGDIEISYPVFAFTDEDLPTRVDPGARYTLESDDEYVVAEAGIAGTSFNFDGMSLDFYFDLRTASVENLSFINTWFTELAVPGTYGIDPVRFEVPLYEVGGIEAGEEIAPGISYTAITPQGVEGSAAQDGDGPAGAVVPLTLEIVEPLITLDANPLEVAAEVADTLRFAKLVEMLGLLTEEFAIDLALPDGNEIGGSLAYTVFAPVISGGYGLSQTATFRPAPISMSVEIEGDTQTGLLGDDFTIDVMAADDPRLADGTLDGRITYGLSGILDVDYRIVPTGSLSVTALSAETTVTLNGEAVDERALPALYDETFTTSSDLGSFSILTQEIVLQDDFFDAVTYDFSIPVSAVDLPNRAAQLQDPDGFLLQYREEIEVLEGQVTALGLGEIRVVDPDDPVEVVVWVEVASGTLLAGPSLALDLSGDGTDSLTLRGSPAALSSYLSGEHLSYVPDADVTGARLRFFTDDLSGSGPVLAAEADIAVVDAGDESVDGARFIGGANDDNFVGDDAPNFISGGGGNDGLIGNDAGDVISGGPGDDEIWGDNRDADGVDPDFGDGDRLFGGPGNDRIIGGRGPDIILGGPGDDVIRSAGPDSRMLGEEGDDVIDGAGFIDGGPGNDTLGGSGDGTILHGREGNDSIDGQAEAHGDAGNDTVLGAGLVTGGDGDDTIGGWTAGDRLEGGDGNDRILSDGNGREPGGILTGESDVDTVFAGAGDDTIVAELRRGESFAGGTGTDDLHFARVATAPESGVSGQTELRFDLLRGQVLDGDERVIAALSGIENLTVSLANASIGAQARVVYVGTGDENRIEHALDVDADMRGGSRDDTLISGDGTDLLSGQSGDDLLRAGGNDSAFDPTAIDTLKGGGGNDTLEGEDGDDLLNGGSGVDDLFGGDGDDTLLADTDDRILAGGAGRDLLDLSTDGSAAPDVLRIDISAPAAQTMAIGARSIQISGIEDVTGRPEGDDLLIAPEGTGARVDGHGGDDTVIGGSEVHGGAGVDLLVTTHSGNFELLRSAGQDQLPGASLIMTGFENLVSGNGDDTILASDRTTHLDGRDGDDVLLLLREDMEVIGGAGADRADYGLARVGLTFDLENGTIVDHGGNARGHVFGVEYLATPDASSTVTGTAAEETLVGGDGSDVLLGAGGADALLGGQGEDEIFGGAGDDRIDGGRDGDLLSGGLGSDSVDGGRGRDTIVLGAGDDTADGGDGNDVILAGDGRDIVEGGAGDDRIFAEGNVADPLVPTDGNIGGGAGNDIILAGDGDDLIRGDDGDDTLAPGRGFDEVRGGAGADLFVLSPDGGNDFLQDFSAEDRFHVLGAGFEDLTIREDFIGETEVRLASGKRIFLAIDFDAFDAAFYLEDAPDLPAPPRTGPRDPRLGTASAEALAGGDGADLMFGRGGDDSMDGDLGHDSLLGGLGDDSASGGRGDDTLGGDQGDDSLQGGPGDDALIGGAGDDFLGGNAGADTLDGGDGADRLRGQKNADHLAGDAGDDNLKGGGGNDTLLGGEGNDFLNGGTRRDSLEGGTGDDRLIGRSFSDTLIGGHGDDYLNGGGDDDRLEGGRSDDRMKGGAGADVFYFFTNHATGDDAILDFTPGEDVLEIRGMTFGEMTIAARGGDTLITLERGTVLLRGVEAGAIDAGAFDFV